MNKLELSPCKEIVASYYVNSTGDEKESGSKSYRNRLRAFITGSAYCGPHARFWLWDLLAGGVQNNFFFSYFARSEYGAFIYFLDVIEKNHPNPQTVFSAIKEATDINSIYAVILNNKNYLPAKYLIDLSEQLTDYERSNTEQWERKKDTWSNRLSKSLTFFGAICEGLIDLLPLISWIWFSHLAASITNPVFLIFFIGGFVANYYIYRQDSTKFFAAALSLLFDTPEKDDNKPYDNLRAVKILISLLASLATGLCVCALTVGAIQAALTITPIVLPLIAIKLIATPMIVLVCGICFNAAKEIIDADAHKEKKDKESTRWEIAKFVGAFAVSSIIALMTFFLFKNKLFDFFNKTLKILACALASIAAVMRFTFSIVTLTKTPSTGVKPPEAAITSLHQEKPALLTDPARKTPTTSTAAMLCPGAHSLAQGGLFLNEARNAANDIGAPHGLGLALGAVAGLSNMCLGWNAARSGMSQSDHPKERKECLHQKK